MRVCPLLVVLLAAPALAGEGKWTPQQVLSLGPAWVKQQGFGLPLEKLWSAKSGKGLLANAVNLNGCSGSFISPEGLLITNHHCVVGILQQHSSPEENLVRDGFLARTRGDEKKAAAYRIQVPRAFRDVTAEVQAAVPTGASDLERFAAIESKQKALVASCEKVPHTRCDFAAYDGGAAFGLTEYAELTDIRLVYAPPEGVGNFGGDVDNWSWPRHTGDFSLVRAYGEDGAPYKPEFWFPVSTAGVKPGDAVAVLGYPGRSFRALLSSEMRERQDRYFPAVASLSAEWIALLQRESKADPAAGIAVADTLESLQNREKNARGQLVGLARGRFVERAAQAEAQVVAWAEKRPDASAAIEAKAAIDALTVQRLETWEKDFLLDALDSGAKALGWPVVLARRATEASKGDLEREPGFMERDLPRLRERLERDQKRYFAAVDRALMSSWVRRALALPKEQRIAAVDQRFGGARDDAQLQQAIAALYAKSQVLDLPSRKAMFDESADALRARKDPLLSLGFALDLERKGLKARRDAWAGAGYRLRPPWRRAVLAQAGRAIAPDANGSLRVTFGRVKGYSPRDALVYAPQTTLAGVLEKDTQAPPFDVPAKVRAAAANAPKSRFADARLGDVPVAFLSDCDTTGGNSGSPTIDGSGKLVGVNFDRVWENVANDFGYNPDIARNVNVDVRYLLWSLDEVEGAAALLGELGVRK